MTATADHTSTPRVTDPGAARVTVRYWAAAKAAAGLAEEEVPATTLAEALSAIRGRHPDNTRLHQVLAHCSYLVDGEQVGNRDHATVDLPPGATVEALPPFAGG
ncbi:MoaD/ThiS family protein [Kitasatospora sp. NPDC004289]